MVTKIEIYKGRGLIYRWRWRAKARNGEIVATSQGYTRKWSAKRAARKTFPGITLTDLTAAG